MTPEDLKEEVKKIIVEHLAVRPEDMGDTTSFTHELGLDSLDAMDLLVAIDEALGVRIPPKEMEQVDSLDALVQAIIRHQVS